MTQDLAVLQPKPILPFRIMKMCATNQNREAQIVSATLSGYSESNLHHPVDENLH